MNIKSSVSGFLRKSRLLFIAEKLRFYWQKQLYKKVNKKFRIEHPEFDLPPEFFIYETYRLNYQWYWDDGQNTAAEIVKFLSKHFDINRSGVRIMDWGCGPGRIVRHFHTLLPNAEIYGTDYNEKYIDWCRQHLKEISFSINQIDPPTNFDDDFFDAIIGLSIFTHLSEKGHRSWLDELYRIVKPGKFIYITTQGAAYYAKLTTTEKKFFDANRLVIRSYLKEGNRLYSTFQPMLIFKNLVKHKFDVVEFIGGTTNKDEPAQDIWILQKK